MSLRLRSFNTGAAAVISHEESDGEQGGQRLHEQRGQAEIQAAAQRRDSASGIRGRQVLRGHRLSS
jgi:hypothetical protein